MFTIIGDILMKITKYLVSSFIFSSIIAEKINGSKEVLFNKKYTTTITRL